MPRALIVEIFGNAQQFASELDRAAGKTRQFGRAAGVAGIAIAGGLAYGIEKSVKAAAGAQVSTARLSQAFKQSGESATSYAGQIDKAEGAGRNLGFMNTDLRESLGSLEIATHNHTQAIKDMGVAEDIARFKHVGLTDASKVLTMAMAGSQRATKQLGLTLAPVTTAEDKVKEAFKKHSGAAYDAAIATAKLADKQKTAADVIDLVSKKLHGQASAFADTAAGKMKVYQAQMEALQENIGAGLLPILSTLAGALANVTGWMAKHTDVAKILIVTLGILGGVLLAVSVYTKLASAATVIWSAITKAATAAQWLLNAALAANPIGLVVIALAALGVALYLAWTKSQTFRNIVEGAWHGIQAAAQAVVNFFTSTVPNAFDTVRRTAVTAANAIKGVWDGIKSAWAAAWNGIVNAIIGPIKTAIGWIQTLISLIHSIPSIHIPNIGHAGSNTPTLHHPGSLKGSALGGVFNVPTLAMIGERGPEAVVPLNRAGLGTGVGGGSPTINVTVHGWVGSDQQIAQRLRNELVAVGRREPNIFAGYA